MIQNKIDNKTFKIEYKLTLLIECPRGDGKEQFIDLVFDFLIDHLKSIDQNYAIDGENDKSQCWSIRCMSHKHMSHIT